MSCLTDADINNTLPQTQRVQGQLSPRAFICILLLSSDFVYEKTNTLENTNIEKRNWKLFPNEGYITILKDTHLI